MDHNKTPDYLAMHAMASRMLKAGEIRAFCTGYTSERGRYIEVETEQGWCPDPMWQEIPAAYNPEQDY